MSKLNNSRPGEPVLQVPRLLDSGQGRGVQVPGLRGHGPSHPRPGGQGGARVPEDRETTNKERTR